MVFTDGKSSGNIYNAAQQLKNIGVVIFSIGVGSRMNLSELETMASDPTDNHVFLLRNTSEFSNLTEKMALSTCNGKL